jgi:hypothetical protein
MKFSTLLTALFFSLFVSAQLPDDALRYGFPWMSGTARNQAIGGAMGSLGGDITSAHINPAGIGMYRNSEFVLSPGFNFMNNKFDYRNTSSSAKDNAFNYGTSGLVFGASHDPRYQRATSSAFSITVNQLANYNNRIQYQGFNNTSSWSEQYVEQLTRDRASIVQAENNYIFGSSLAFWTYLVDTIADRSGNVIGYQSIVPLPLNPNSSQDGVNQYNTIDTRGGAHEVALTYAQNYNNKFNWGLSFGIPFYSFNKEQTYREEDATSNGANDFKYFEYKEKYSTTGVGFNLKLGAIFRPVDRLRIGLAFHTPTWAGLTDNISSSITTNSENYTNKPQPLTKTSDELKAGSNAGTYEYNLTSPMRAIGSISYVINEVKDITKQKGFITADVEYVNYNGVRFRTSGDGTTDDKSYYDDVNEIIKARYKGAFNFKLGGELKFKTLMVRLGGALLGNPYSESGLLGKRTMATGGLGYRNKGMFVDLAYAHTFIKATDVPYYLQDKATPVADWGGGRGNLVLTFGVKF